MAVTRRRLSRGRRVAVVAVLVGALLAGGIAVVLTDRGPAKVVPPSCAFAAGSTGAHYLLTPVQAQNAAIIAAVGLRLGLPDHAVTVALATSLQESNLENLPYGDLDSVGLFQQRPSEGWGTRAQILDPVYSATAFFEHLAQVPGWEAMPVTVAAQSVQRSADPAAYAQWAAQAQRLAEVLTGEIPAGLACQIDAFGGPAPAQTALTAAADRELGGPAIGVTVDQKRGWQVAAWAVAHAYEYHLSSVAFSGERWSAAAGTWSPDPARGAPVVVTR